MHSNHLLLEEPISMASILKPSKVPSRKSQLQNLPSSRSSSPPSPSPPPPQPPVDRDMGATQAMKRIPQIKFPQRHLKPSGSATPTPTPTQAAPAANDVPSTFFSRSAPSDTTLGGKASLQPKRTPMTQEEIDAIMLGGCL